MSSSSFFLKRKSGQSLVEFLFVSVLFIFMLFVSVNALIAFTVHQYLSYASFMSARAFFAGGEAPEDHRRRAYQTLQQFIPQLVNVPLPTSYPANLQNIEFRFPGFPRTLAYIQKIYIPMVNEGDYGPSEAVDRNDFQKFIGIDFAVPFAVALPLGDISKKYAFLKMRVSSFLGREASASECRAYFNLFQRGVLGHMGASEIDPLQMEDQGC